jgi:hypothetical protein
VTHRVYGRKRAPAAKSSRLPRTELVWRVLALCAVALSLLAVEQEQDEDDPNVPWESATPPPPPPASPARREAPPRQAPPRDEAPVAPALTLERGVRLRFVDRTLTVPRDWFALDANLGYERLNPSSPVVALASGASYGVDDDLQVGIQLLRLTMSPNPSSGLEQPRTNLTYRFVRSVFEMGVSGELEIPTSSQYTFAAGLPAMLHIASFARVDLSPKVVVSDQPSWTFSAVMPASLRIQIIDALSIGVDPFLSIPDLRKRDLLIRFGGRASYTISDARGRAFADLDLIASTRDSVLHGSRPTDPAYGNYISVFFAATFYLVNPYDPHGFDGSDRW